jgi:hypothetical protein
VSAPKKRNRSGRKQSGHGRKTDQTPTEPAAAWGPSLLPPSNALIAQQAHQLVLAVKDRRILLLHPARESEQLRSLETAGLYLWPPPPAPAASKSGANAPKMDANSLAAKPSIDSSGTKPILPSGSGEESIAPILPAGRTPGAFPSRHAPPGLRDTEEKSKIENPNASTWVYTPPSPALFQMLNALAAHSTPACPLELMSLLRPPYQTPAFRHAGPRNPHSLGLAADICAYAGHRPRLSDPEECVAIVLALLRDLPPGRYRMGVPKAPEAPLIVGCPPIPEGLAAILTELDPDQPLAPLFMADPALTPLPNVLPSRYRRRQDTPVPALKAPSWVRSEAHPLLGVAIGLSTGMTRRPWPFFPPPEPELENGLVAPLRQNGRVVPDSAGRPQPHILRFRNEGYAPAEALQDGRVRNALTAARKRGVDVFALFPDGADHIHLDVRQQL